MESSENKRPKELTFIEAYKISMKGHSSGNASKTQQDNTSDYLSIREISNDLQNIVNNLEKDKKNTTTMAHLRKLTKNKTAAKGLLITAWTDSDGYDFLHHAIMNNRPEIIHFLLGEEKLFPQSHQPRSNPYAHMAATVGFKGCLEAVLTYRREDFFATSGPRHTIKLPPLLVQRLKLKQSSGGKARKKLYAEGKNDNEDAHLSEVVVESKPNKFFFEKEMEDFKKTFSEKKVKPRKVYNSTLAKVCSKTQCEELKLPPIVEKTPEVRTYEVKTCRKPKITIHWDVFRDEYNNGVIGGAGEPVEVYYADEHAAKAEEIYRRSLGRQDVVRNKSHLSPKVKNENTAPQNHSSSSSRTLQNVRKESRRSSIDVQRSQSRASFKKVEIGIRKYKKLKEFSPFIDSSYLSVSSSASMQKTPLTIAAENGHMDCIRYLLEAFFPQTKTRGESKDHLLLATRARSPEAIAVLLEQKYNKHDLHSAVLLCIRESVFDCLKVFLAFGRREQEQVLPGNLFHTLFTQSLTDGYNYDSMPEMTRLLISNMEDVNAHNPPLTYPLYTLINCAFGAHSQSECFSYLTCLKMLLNAKADPNYNERKNRRRDSNNVYLSRPSYTSAVQCVFANAQVSLQKYENTFWPQILMHKFIVAIEANDQTPRRVKNDILFLYMDFACEVGLNHRILRALLRYGANPDFTEEGKYPLNRFFDATLPYLAKYKVNQKYYSADDILDTLLLLCHAMSADCLHDAVVQFLDEHLLYTPLQAMEITRKFCYRANLMLTSPRSLAHIASHYIWLSVDRNVKRLRLSNLEEELINQILP